MTNQARPAPHKIPLSSLRAPAPTAPFPYPVQPRPAALPFEASLPWLISATVNTALFLLIVFVLYVSGVRLAASDDTPLIVPNSFEDPALAQHPGGSPNAGPGNDPSQQSAQQRLRDIAKTEGWAQTDSPKNLASLLGGQSGDAEAVGIFNGAGGSLGSTAANATGDTKIAAYGQTGAGAGTGPKTSFYGTGGNATRIVYIVDNSGTMLDNFVSGQNTGPLKVEMLRSVEALVPLQYFSVILVSDRIQTLGSGQLQRALPNAKNTFRNELKNALAQGKNDDLLEPFQQAFEKAFSLKPQLIYFLTDGHFDRRLLDVVRRLNKDKSASINTIAFVTEEAAYKTDLENLAKENGGVYHFIPQKALEQ